jgi:hypothetical protein
MGILTAHRRRFAMKNSVCEQIQGRKAKAKQRMLQHAPVRERQHQSDLPFVGFSKALFTKLCEGHLGRLSQLKIRECLLRVTLYRTPWRLCLDHGQAGSNPGRPDSCRYFWFADHSPMNLFQADYRELP